MRELTPERAPWLILFLSAIAASLINQRLPHPFGDGFWAQAAMQGATQLAIMGLLHGLRRLLRRDPARRGRCAGR
ncbi:hypothetical protein [Mitsuaria sp. BK037]|jgi:hypothetical protein|uniref:hypothetical protein n=1 Tax=Mitsuaria sp. BK037 TaxID=2587122 RepID=UPI00160BFFF3|nr:hypothetical protein [Mitsuaria sp. BK037]MBB3282385.1 hypothetical protein [Mitsuaria sp. BK037]